MHVRRVQALQLVAAQLMQCRGSRLAVCCHFGSHLCCSHDIPGICHLQGVGGYNQTGQTGVMHPMGGNTGSGVGMGGSNTGMSNNGMGGGMGGNNPNLCGSCSGAGGTCPQCGGTGSLAQRMEQGMGLGGGRHQQQGEFGGDVGVMLLGERAILIADQQVAA